MDVSEEDATFALLQFSSTVTAAGGAAVSPSEKSVKTIRVPSPEQTDVRIPEEASLAQPKEGSHSQSRLIQNDQQTEQPTQDNENEDQQNSRNSGHRGEERQQEDCKPTAGAYPLQMQASSHNVGADGLQQRITIPAGRPPNSRFAPKNKQHPVSSMQFEDAPDIPLHIRPPVFRRYPPLPLTARTFSRQLVSANISYPHPMLQHAGPALMNPLLANNAVMQQQRVLKAHVVLEQKHSLEVVTMNLQQAIGVAEGMDNMVGSQPLQYRGNTQPVSTGAIVARNGPVASSRAETPLKAGMRDQDNSGSNSQSSEKSSKRRKTTDQITARKLEQVVPTSKEDAQMKPLDGAPSNCSHGAKARYEYYAPPASWGELASVPKIEAVKEDTEESIPIRATDLGPYDVLLGRGGQTNSNPGNIAFRELVGKYRLAYFHAPKGDKGALSRYICNFVRSRGGRFLRVSDVKADCAILFEVGDEKAVGKCAQALREGSGSMRGRLKQLKELGLDEE